MPMPIPIGLLRFAKQYVEAATAAYETGTITIDSLGDSQIRWAKTKLLLIRA